MSPDNKTNEKNQTERLIDFLESGDKIDFLDAFYKLGIQDLRKRLSEVRELGYRLKSHTWERFHQSVTRWSLDPVFKPGHIVRIEASPVFPGGRHPLTGVVGSILSKTKDHTYVVGDAHGRPIGRFRHKDLILLAKHPQGSTVVLRRGDFTVGGFDPATGHYLLKDGDGLGFLLAPALVDTKEDLWA